MAYHIAGKTDQATKEFEAVLAKDSKVMQAHMMLGIIREGLKEYEQAQSHYEAALKLNPRFAPAANNLAWILVEHGGNLDVALSHAQMAREQQPNDSHIADTLGWVYYKKMRIFSPQVSSKKLWGNYPMNRRSTFITA